MAIDISDLRRVAEATARLGLPHAFTGGAVLPLLFDDPHLTPSRPTGDVDVIVEVVTRIEVGKMEAELERLKFRHDMSDGAPRCRWIFGGIKVDMMPVEDPMGEFRTRWFGLAVDTAEHRTVEGGEVPVVTAPCFLALKIAAFLDRGRGDFQSSHDIEDILAVVDGRAALPEELASAPADMRRHVANTLRSWLATSAFNESLSGHLQPDAGSQGRLPLLRARLADLAALG